MKQGLPERFALASFLALAKGGLHRSVENPVLRFLCSHQQTDRHFYPCQYVNGKEEQRKGYQTSTSMPDHITVFHCDG